MDHKISELAQLEVVERLLARGARPRRTIYRAFGHDEEVGGTGGARAIMELLRSRGVRPEYVLDEGGFITAGITPFVARPVALVAVAEKGYVSVELSAEGGGGHSSMPPPETVVGIPSAAIGRLEARQFPAQIDGATARLFESIGPEMPLAQRVLFANLWLFSPLVERLLAATPETDAAIRTTTAPTVFNAGVKDNVLPVRGGLSSTSASCRGTALPA